MVNAAVPKCEAETKCLYGHVTCDLPRGHDGNHHRFWANETDSFTWSDAYAARREKKP